jgi:hypothetical protein
MDSSVEQLTKFIQFCKTVCHPFHLQKALIMHKEEIIKAYEQGYREGQEDSNLGTLNGKDVSQFTNGKDYYKNTFKK